MGVFRFKKFEVVNERSAMKVNTDGVLLGAAVTIMPDDRNFLDIGTGTGTIALMVAQRSFADAHDGIRIDAIDIDEPSASEAAMNFAQSPWAESLKAHNMSLDEFASSSESPYDLIFSNPPYFEDSLTAPDERKSTARHTSDGLSYRDIFDFASDRLTQNGRVSFVLPADQEAALCRYARMSGFHLFRILRIRTVPRKSPTRIIAEFARERCEHPSDTILTIQDEGKYTQEYLSLTHDFYLFA
ncbi:MAG: methyltransferase [Bacteroidales bacterium]|nr:methyltransferase [Bacteroidales bacterium]